MSRKKELGQFFTTNSSHIIGDLINNLKGSEIIDPFAGGWDILKLFEDNYTVRGLDIDPKNDKTEKCDSLLNPINYTGKTIVTNPPYLMNNKSKDPNNIKIFQKFPDYIDLYQISMHTFIGADEGIVIIPINFWTAERSGKIRKEFLSRYFVKEVKLFYYQVFDDTDYSVCAFYFEKSPNKIAEQDVNFRLMIDKNSEESKTIKLKEDNNFSISVSLMNDPELKLGRVSSDDSEGSTKIKLYLTDSAPGKYGIRASIEDVYFCNKAKDRHYFTLKSNKKINETEFVEKFNSELTTLRDTYKSLFLGNYRNGNRKKFTINDALKFSNHIITKFNLVIDEKE